jgi:hypothetical protein
LPRKQRMTQLRQRMMVGLLMNGHTISGACEAINVSRTTKLKFRKENEDYRRKVEEALDARVEIVEDALFALAVSGSYHAQRFWLLNRARNRWKAESHHYLSGEGGGPIEIPIREIIVAPLLQPELDEEFMD